MDEKGEKRETGEVMGTTKVSTGRDVASWSDRDGELEQKSAADVGRR